jgi:hypothetical protein
MHPSKNNTSLFEFQDNVEDEYDEWGLEEEDEWGLKEEHSLG